MGNRDFGRKETKKPKKDAKSSSKVEIAPSPIEVQVIKKGKKEPRAE